MLIGSLKQFKILLQYEKGTVDLLFDEEPENPAEPVNSQQEQDFPAVDITAYLY